MESAPEPREWDRDRPFRYVGGDPALDFVNTVDWTPAGLRYDRLAGYERLVEWARGAGLLTPAEAAAFARAAARHPRKAAAAVARARALRHALHGIVVGRAPAALDRFNRFLGPALAAVRLDRGPGGALRLAWPWQGPVSTARGGEPDPADLLRPVVRAAADLLASADAARIRVCGGPDCGWVFVDRSRNRRRRWCEMATCGTAAKERRRAGKRRA